MKRIKSILFAILLLIAIPAYAQQSILAASYGVKCDGVTDNAITAQKAVDAGNVTGYKVEFPAGTCLTGKLTIYSNTKIVGQGRNKTAIKLNNSANTDLIYGSGSDALWGSNTNAGITNYQIEGLTLDGNLANNASGGSCLAVYGSSPLLRDLFIKNCKTHGIRTEWYQYGEGPFGMEGTFKNITIDTTGQHGWWNNGPHDSHIENIIIIDASQTTTNTYDGYFNDTYGASHHFNVHSWTRSTTTNVPRYGLNITAGGGEFFGCITDTGGTAGIYLGPASHYTLMSDFRATGIRGGRSLIVRSNFNKLSGVVWPKYSGAPNPIAITLGNTGGDSVIGNIIDVQAIEQLGGAVDWTYSGGSNKVTVRGVVAGGGVNMVGSPSANDSSDIRLAGAGHYRYKREPIYAGITAAGTTQGSAATLFQGYDLYQIATVAAGTGVVLWTTVDGGEGFGIFNAGGNTLKVYPASGDQINGLGTNNPITIAPGSGRTFKSISTSQWYAW